MIDFSTIRSSCTSCSAAIADYNIAQVREALEYDIDAVYFGDDWGQQHGLQMGPRLWREFIYPQLQRMYAAVRRAGKFVMIHSCGDVDELFDDLVAIGLNCFNPFQPEVMDVYGCCPAIAVVWRFTAGCRRSGRCPSAAWPTCGPSPPAVGVGREGGYIFAPAHDVEGDVPLENMLAAIEVAQGQLGFARRNSS